MTDLRTEFVSSQLHPLYGSLGGNRDGTHQFLHRPSSIVCSAHQVGKATPSTSRDPHGNLNATGCKNRPASRVYNDSCEFSGRYGNLPVWGQIGRREVRGTGTGRGTGRGEAK